MAHVALDNAQIDTGFEEMGGIGMAQGVNSDPFFTHAGIKLRTAEWLRQPTESARVPLRSRSAPR